MIKFENISVHGFEEAIRGMRNPMNSWNRSDSCYNKEDYDSLNGKKYTADESTGFCIGYNDHSLMMKLATNGSVHAKYRRMITVYMDITAPLYWWKEFDTYKVGTVTNSCSTMHKIHEKEFTLEDFSHEHLEDFEGFLDNNTGMTIAGYFESCLCMLIDYLNTARKLYLQTGDKQYWWQVIQLLPSSYNQRRTVMMNYEVLAGIYPMRKDHKLDEWQEFCRLIEKLPYSEVITLDAA